MSTSLSSREQLIRQIDQRWDSLTKPPGSLGRLEDMVRRLGVIQGAASPKLERKAMFVFCADHGVAEAGVSAFPQEVTPQMVRNFITGGAAISVLCRRFSIEPVVVDAGVKGPVIDGSLNRRVAQGYEELRQGAGDDSPAGRAGAGDWPPGGAGIRGELRHHRRR